MSKDVAALVHIAGFWKPIKFFSVDAAQDYIDWVKTVDDKINLRLTTV